MTRKVILVALLFAPGAYADTLENAAQFLELRPEIQQWELSPSSLVDGWERANGVGILISLRYSGDLSASWAPKLNRRISGLRQLPVLPNASPEAHHLGAMTRLFARYADMHMMGELKYADFAAYRDYLAAYGKRLAESIRGKKYQEGNCTWDNMDDCTPTMPVWAQ